MTLSVTDLFAGFGGASSGAIEVPGVDIRIAANHWKLAVEVHGMNHENTDHACVDLHLEDPAYFPKTDILWASPECTKWSQAGGSRNGDLGRALGDWTLFDDIDDDLLSSDEDEATRSRLLMFDVLRFIEHHRYAAVIVENVVDIAMRDRYRPAWNSWQKGLRALGYDYRVVSLNSMHAQALGAPAPQSRDRLYVVAWPKGNRVPDVERFMRPAAYCPRCDTVGESRQAWKNGKTVGKYRAQYVYICAATGCGEQVEPGWLPAAAAIDWTLAGTRIGDRDRPLADKTRARIAAGIARYWRPQIIEATGNTYDAADPRHPQYGDPNAYYRTWPIEEYLRGLHTTASKALLVPVEGRDGKRATSCDDPMRTQTTRSETALLTPFIAELRGGGSDARSVDDPLATVCASGNHHALLTPYYSGSTHAKPVDEPIGTLTTVDRYALIQRMNSGGAEMTTPASEYLRTITTAGHQSLLTPGDVEAAMAQVDDCLFRMLEPSEIGAGMAFAADYKVKGTRRDQVKGYGNAVTPPAARDLVGAVAESFGAGA
jgi:DNA (cytosine-5)-methyltransferase 1